MTEEDLKVLKFVAIIYLVGAKGFTTMEAEDCVEKAQKIVGLVATE